LVLILILLGLVWLVLEYYLRAGVLIFNWKNDCKTNFEFCTCFYVAISYINLLLAFIMVALQIRFWYKYLTFSAKHNIICSLGLVFGFCKYWTWSWSWNGKSWPFFTLPMQAWIQEC